MGKPKTVTWTSREAYYKHLMSGQLASQRDRLMLYLLNVGRPVTRHEIVDRYFWLSGAVAGGPEHYALDGGSPIPWQSATGAIAGMVCREEDCAHPWPQCLAFIAVDHIGICPVTGEKAECLVPIGDNWQQRKLFTL